MSEAAQRDIQAERQRQIESLGYTAEHDDQHSPVEFASMIANYLEEIDAELGGRDAGRLNFVKIGALAMAAIESIDRRG